MAGVGFELKKLYRKRGVLAHLVAVGYTGLITTGPLLLGVVFLMLVSWLGRASGLGEESVTRMFAMVTYALIASQLVNGVLSTVLTRHVSDMLYLGRDETVVPSLVGALALVLPVSGLLYLAFLLSCGLNAGLVLLNETLFLELVGVWIEMSYLTAVKDYRGILGTYAVSIAASLLVALALCRAGLASVEALVGCVCLGYGLMMALGMGLLCLSFPSEKREFFAWTPWLDRYPALVGVGVLTVVGLFAHVLIGWADPAIHEQAVGLMYVSPGYDIPSFYAVLTMIPTTVVFVAGTETEFYPYYRRYFDLLNGTGSISQVGTAQEEMVAVMRRELSRLVRTQMLFTVCVVAFGIPLLHALPIGFVPSMDTHFFVLTLGYDIFAVGNAVVLLIMYYGDYADALLAAGVFAACCVAGSLGTLCLPTEYLGAGFLVAAVAYLAVASARLYCYLKTLPGSIMLEQPLVASRDDAGLFARLGKRLDRSR